MNLSVLTEYQNVIQLLEGKCSDEKNELTGFIELNPANISSLKRLVTNGLCQEALSLYQDDNLITPMDLSQVKEAHFSYKGKVSLSTSKVHEHYFIGKGWDFLLSYSDYIVSPVKAIYLIDTDELIHEDSQNITFNNYLNVAALCGVIDRVAQVKGQTVRKILFGQQLDIPFKLDESYLAKSIDHSALLKLVNDDIHQEAKEHLIREALFTSLRDVSIDLRLKHLIEHFTAFSSNLLVSYEHFINDYTFSKLREEYQEKKTEYIAKVNKVFDDVSAKLFSIPAGVWLAVSQIQPAAMGEIQFHKNILVLIVVFVLSLIVCMMLVGQFKTLDALESEYKGLFHRLTADFKGEKSEITGVLRDIENRKTAVYFKIWSSIILSIVLSILSAVLMWGSIQPPA
jgi:hypothetical protein